LQIIKTMLQHSRQTEPCSNIAPRDTRVHGPSVLSDKPGN
jgi:hypothetical protein